MKRNILLGLLLISSHLGYPQGLLEADSTFWLPKAYVDDLLMRNDPSTDKPYCKPFMSLFTHEGRMYARTFRGKFGAVSVEKQGNTWVLTNFQHLINLDQFPREEYADVDFIVKPFRDSIQLIRRKGGVLGDTTSFIVPLRAFRSENPSQITIRLLLAGDYRAVGERGESEIIRIAPDGNIESRHWKRFSAFQTAGTMMTRLEGARSWYRLLIEDIHGNVLNGVAYLMESGDIEIYEAETDRQSKHFLNLNSRVVLTPVQPGTLLADTNHVHSVRVENDRIIILRKKQGAL